MPTEDQNGQMPPSDAPAEDSGGNTVPDWVRDPIKAYEEIQKLRRSEAAERTKRLEAEKVNRTADEKPATTDDKPDPIKALQERLDAAEKREREANERAWRTNAAAKHGLPVALASRIQGATEAEMDEDAKALAASIPALPAAPTQTTKPAPSGNAQGETLDQKRARLLGVGAGGVNPLTGKG